MPIWYHVFIKNNDARRLDHKTLTELRMRAVNSVQEGQSPEMVAKAIGINRVAMYGHTRRVVLPSLLNP
jgi:hypothetical protein